MTKSLIRSMLVAAAVSGVAAPAVFGQGAAQAPLRVAYINSQRILAEAPGRAEAEATYDKEVGAVRAQIQQMGDSLKAMYAALQKDQPTLDSVKLIAREKAIMQRRDDYQGREQKLDEQMQQRQAQLARPLMDQMAKVLDEFRQKNGYAIIFDVGTQASAIVSADTSLDITTQVLARLKQLGPPPMASGPLPPAGPLSKPAGVRRP